MGIDAWTSKYGFSGWSPVKAERQVSRTYDRQIGPPWWPPKFQQVTDTWSESHDSKYVQRSAKLSGQLVSFGGKRIRLPTNYDLGVYERSDFGRTISTYTSGATKRTDYLSNPQASDYAAGSGLWSGYIPRHLADASNEAQTTALNRLTDGKTEGGTQASFGSALLQMRSTLSDIGRLSTALLSGTKHAMEGNWKSALGAFGLSQRDASIRGVAEKFLFVNYGIMPTVGDLKDLHAVMSDHAKKSKFLTVSGKATRSENRSGTSGYNQWTTSVDTTARCKIRAVVIDPVIHSLSQNGLINPLSIAWDLVPYSFVFDWWLPIGDILRGYESSLGLQFVSGYISQTTNGYAHMIDIERTLENGGRAYGSTPTKDVGFHFTRSALDRFPMPDMYVKKRWASTWRGAEALALYAQTIRR